MAAFYSRYVPPAKSTGAPEAFGEKSSKRKHNGALRSDENIQKRRKTEIDKVTNGPTTVPNQFELPQRRELEEASSFRKEGHPHARQTQNNERTGLGEQVLAKYSLSKKIKTPSQARSPGNDEENVQVENLKGRELSSDFPTPPKSKKKKTKHDGDLQVSVEVADSTIHDPEEDDAGEMQTLDLQRHAKIRSKFLKSKAKARTETLNGSGDGLSNGSHDETTITAQDVSIPIVLHGLEPLPQPTQVDHSEETPTYSTLPRWMAKPLRVSPSTHSNFEELGLGKHILSNLSAKGLLKPFAIQSAVIPLLLGGSSRHLGDLCISAATGSGKTLAYILPMIEGLKDLLGTKLRGLIVVPTRELVNQAREVCEICAAGTNLRIATALGSKALKDEQDILVEEHMAYDPEQYKEEQEALIDWTSVGLEDLLLQSDGVARKANYIKRFSSKVDILICTPGRLVDHLRSTPGFTLDDVQWVVIDEADRLLNESFQEWVETVVPGLSSGTATEKRDGLLREMRLEVPQRRVQKIILSATMTQDVSKLNSLALYNPKLVILGDLMQPQVSGILGGNDEPVADAGGVFTLPPTLSEAAVSVNDESQKPLYLLRLLYTHILNHGSVGSGSLRHSHENNITKLHETSATDESDQSSSSESSLSSDSDSSSDSDAVSNPPLTTPKFSNPKSAEHSPTYKPQTALIFTRSTESASRLSRLLSLLSPSLSPTIGTLTRSTNSSPSRKTLSQFRQGKLAILIATDRASRGLDLPGLGHVVSYDVPTSATTYIHRVGRTARAGKEGGAWTLVSHREARWFWNEVGKGTGEVKIERKEKVRRVDIEDVDRDGMKERYEDALKKLGKEVRGDDGA